MVTKRPHPTHWAGPAIKAASQLARVRGRPRRVVVSGPSMLPTFQPGDRLVVVPMSRVAAGHVVALHDPTDPGRILVKRVQGRLGDGWDVRGDNDGASTDTRSFGPVPAGAVIGRVVYRYHPPDRAGWLAE